MTPSEDYPLFSRVGIKKGERLNAEIEEGNREYKFKLTGLSEEQLNHRMTQLNWRLNEGNDEAVYLIVVEDDGNQLGLSDADLQESLKTLQFMADKVGCDMLVKQLYTGEQGITAEVLMRRKERLTVDVAQVSVAVAGDLDSGKSTLIGVLSSGQLDNGNGLARAQVLTHNHEVETGRTSCISHHTLHFNRDGEVLNADPLPGTGSGKSNRLRALSDLELADQTHRSVTLIDLAGHAKYLKTTLHGLIGRRPDYSMVCISGTAGMQSMTAEHIGISLYLNVPLVIVITKLDQLQKQSRNEGTTSRKLKKKAAVANKNVYSKDFDPVSTRTTTSSSSSSTLRDNVIVTGTGTAQENEEKGIRSGNVTIKPEEDNEQGEGEGGGGGEEHKAVQSPLGRLIDCIVQVLNASGREAVVIHNQAELVQFLLQTSSTLTSDGEPSVSSSGNGSSKGFRLKKPSKRKPLKVPIFALSNVSGEGLLLLRSYLYQLPTSMVNKQQWEEKQHQSTFVRVLGSIGSVTEDPLESRLEMAYEIAQKQHAVTGFGNGMGESGNNHNNQHNDNVSNDSNNSINNDNNNSSEISNLRIRKHAPNKLAREGYQKKDKQNKPTPLPVPLSQQNAGGAAATADDGYDDEDGGGGGGERSNIMKNVLIAPVGIVSSLSAPQLNSGSNDDREAAIRNDNNNNNNNNNSNSSSSNHSSSNSSSICMDRGNSSKSLSNITTSKNGGRSNAQYHKSINGSQSSSALSQHGEGHKEMGTASPSVVFSPVKWLRKMAFAELVDFVDTSTNKTVHTTLQVTDHSSDFDSRKNKSDMDMRNNGSHTFRKSPDINDLESSLGRETQIDNSSSSSQSSTELPSSDGRTKVLIGSIESGRLEVGEPLVFGPTSTGAFITVVVCSLRLNNVAVRYANAGQTVTLKLAQLVLDAQEQIDKVLSSSCCSTSSDAFESSLMGKRRSTAAGLVLLAPTILPVRSGVLPAGVAPAPPVVVVPTPAGRTGEKDLDAAAAAAAEEEDDEEEGVRVDMHAIKSAAATIVQAPHTSNSSSSGETVLMHTQALPVTGTLAPVEEFVDSPLTPTSVTVEKPLVHWEFEAELLVLNHPSRIRVNYEPVVHVGCIKQTAKIVAIRKLAARNVSGGSMHAPGNDNLATSPMSPETPEATPSPLVAPSTQIDAAAAVDEIGNGDRAVCRFRFLYYPEFISKGETMLIRENRTRGVGTIIRLC